MKWIVTGFLLFFSSQAFSQAIRFQEDQIQFFLEDNGSKSTICQHKLLSHVPWWNVQCGRREFTVNTWAQVGHNRPLNLTKVTLMYDVSESVASSGQRTVQFHSHMTDVFVDSLTNLKVLSTSMDIQNGQKSLTMRAMLF